VSIAGDDDDIGKSAGRTGSKAVPDGAKKVTRSTSRSDQFKHALGIGGGDGGGSNAGRSTSKSAARSTSKSAARSTSKSAAKQKEKKSEKKKKDKSSDSGDVVEQKPTFGEKVSSDSGAGQFPPHPLEAAGFPQFILDIFAEIEKSTVMIEEEGLYRKAGSSSAIMKVIEDIKSGQPVDSSPALALELGDVVKRYIRTLTTPLIDPATAMKLITSIDALSPSSSNDDAAEERVCDVVHGMSNPERAALLSLLRHLSKVAVHTKQNLMNPHSLAIVFAPNLFEKQGDAATQLNSGAGEAQVVENLITLAGKDPMFTRMGGVPEAVDLSMSGSAR